MRQSGAIDSISDAMLCRRDICSTVAFGSKHPNWDINEEGWARGAGGQIPASGHFPNAGSFKDGMMGLICMCEPVSYLNLNLNLSK